MNDGKHSRGEGPRRGEVARSPAWTLGSRQFLSVALLFGGYAACYFCRADFSVATPLLIEELGSHGVRHADAIVHIGQIASLGVFAYALGKLFLTGLGDFWGGRPNFLIGLGGATFERFGGRLHGRRQRMQLVGDVRSELAPRLLVHA